MKEGAEDIKNGNYLSGASKLATPALFGSGLAGNLARFGVGTYNLFNEDGVQKTYNFFKEGRPYRGALSLLGDALNLGMATSGGSSLLKSGYRWTRKLKPTTSYAEAMEQMPHKVVGRYVAPTIKRVNLTSAEPLMASTEKKPLNSISVESLQPQAQEMLTPEAEVKYPIFIRKLNENQDQEVD